MVGTFALEAAALAVMSNHYHIVLYIDSTTAKTWSDTETVHRGQELFNTSILTQLYVQSHTLDHREMEKLNELIALWRE
ncbi:hypothetical protein ACJJIW_13445 [Microbulbifer sp. JMSA004]|uniref:hypothetical protein n=1 Tax=unclassified Microbulbifer TaxID=2619833 RepID=UPI0024ADC41A|nr:hypothetical protein [Microbulbifer sp. VAAF005]WHI47982.1 hypothetical protein P0078_06260 [Microbulbifer sp. VAAF005]